MANVKKNSAVSSEEEITREETTEKVYDNNDKEMEDLKKENKELRNQLKEQKSQIDQIMEMLKTSAAQTAPTKTDNEIPQDVTVVHLVQRARGLSTYIHLSNIDLVLTAFGEEVTVTPQQFDELAGKYRNLFETGVLAVGDKCEYYARRKKLKCAGAYYNNYNLFSELGRLSMSELESIYNQVEMPLKSSIAEYFKQRIVANDPAFKDIRKIEVMNRLTNGGFITELQTFSRR